MNKKHLRHNVILSLIISCLTFTMYFLIKINIFVSIIVFVLTTCILTIFIYGYNTRYYNGCIKSVIDISKDLKFKNILYSLLVESSNVDKREDFYQLILNKSVEAIPNADKGTILRMQDNYLMAFEASKGYDLERLKTVELSIEQTFLYKRTEGKMNKSTIINNFNSINESTNLDKDKQKTLDSSLLEINTIISTPIWVSGKIWGMINIDSFKIEAFDQSSIESLEIFAKEVSKAITLFDTLEKNSYLVKYDVLTDIYNRSYFNQLTSELLARDHSNNTQCIATLTAIDLDKFKRINDLYGHQVGDAYLVFFSKTIKSFLKESDYFARYGGDEFIILTIDELPEKLTERMAHIKRFFEENPLNYGGELEVVGFSYGMAHYPKDGISSKLLLEIADQRMYDLKNSKVS